MSEPDPLEEAFAAALATWDDDEAHQRYLAMAQALGRLPEAGRRYREIKESDPVRAPGAQKRLDSLLALALADLAQRRPARDVRPQQRMFWVALGVALMLAATALYELTHR